MNRFTNKKKLFFRLTILVIILTTILLTVFSLIDLGRFRLLVVAGTLIISLLILSTLKYYLDYYLFQEQYYFLLSGQEEPFRTKKNILSKDWESKLIRENYKSYFSDHDLTIMFKIEDIMENKKRTKTLILLLLIHNPKLKFESTYIINKINDIELEIRKKNYFNQRIFIHFKKFDNISKDNLKLANNVFWIKKKRQFITSINVCYFEKESLVHFIHNKNYVPNIYYKFATSEIFKLSK